MNNYLEKYKIVLELEKIEKELMGHFRIGFNTRYTYDKMLYAVKHHLGLPEKSTPKALYGKPYSELSKEELAEYTQIKRLIKRNS